MQCGRTQRVPGWHVDGYQGHERNPKQPIDRTYFGANVPPTLYIDDYHFHLDHLNDDFNMFNACEAEIGYVMHDLATLHDSDPERYQEIVDAKFGDVAGTDSTFPDIIRSVDACRLYFMDAYTVHSPSAPPHDLHRAFFRLQFSAAPYDRMGYTDNPLFCGGTPLFNRIEKPYPEFKGAKDHPDAQSHPYHKDAQGEYYDNPLHVYYGDMADFDEDSDCSDTKAPSDGDGDDTKETKERNMMAPDDGDGTKVAEESDTKMAPSDGDDAKAAEEGNKKTAPSVPWFLVLALVFAAIAFFLRKSELL